MRKGSVTFSCATNTGSGHCTCPHTCTQHAAQCRELEAGRKNHGCGRGDPCDHNLSSHITGQSKNKRAIDKNFWGLVVL